MRKLKKSFYIFVVFLQACLQPLSAQSYTITEDELQRIEKNQETILRESEKLRAQSAQQLAELKQQLETQSEQLQKSEKEKNLIIKVGIPAAVVITAAAFCAGVYTGARVAP